jgi:acyl carrier protein
MGDAMEAKTTDNLEKLVYDTFEEIGFPRGELDESAGLEDLDIDSLDVVEVAQVVAQEFNLALEAEHFEGVQSFGDVMEVFRTRLQAEQSA